jgi:N-acetylglucosaminyldiphosphoundecaprenol N-acetyl-beta-D-mannosaminyltransferase
MRVRMEELRDREGARPLRSVTLAGIELHGLNFSQTVRWIVDRAKSGSGGYVCTPNVDYIVRAVRDPAFREVIQRADLRVPDGMWVIYGSRIAGHRGLATVTGRLLPEAVGRVLARDGQSIALFGGGPGVAESAAGALKRRGVLVSSASGPSMKFVVGSDEDRRWVDELRQSPARVIFVALGAPKQETWMAAHAEELAGRVLVGVGAALDVLGGRVREAPRWLTALGMEWAFRLVQEPRRLSRRYLWDDPRFLWWMIQERMGHRRTFSDS